jgi:hypothetical protein
MHVIGVGLEISNTFMDLCTNSYHFQKHWELNVVDRIACYGVTSCGLTYKTLQLSLLVHYSSRKMIIFAWTSLL